MLFISSKTKKALTSGWWPLLALLLGGILVMKLIISIATARVEERYRPAENVVLTAYQAKIAQEKNVAKLAKVADGLMKKNMLGYALLNFKRAAELDPNYRDMAYGWAYCLLQTKQSTLSPDDIKELHMAIDQAEAVDPEYIPLLNLKIIVAKIENNTQAIDAAQSRLNLLTKQ